MAELIPQRMTARVDHEFAIFLIGMRVNTWWRPDLWLPVALAMRRMLRELRARPEAGLLGVVSGGLGNPTVLVQYWRSVEQLMAYVNMPRFGLGSFAALEPAEGSRLSARARLAATSR